MITRSQGGGHQAGIALMEALVAILIFSFGVLGLIALEASAVNFAVDSEDRNRAALFAGSVSVTNAQLAPQVVTWQANISNPTTTGLNNGTLTITPVAGTTNAADIVITWKPPARATTSSASTLTTRVILP
jgi:type IV pilus assembly protein PilV